MKDIIQEISSPKWWFSTVIIGIAIGLFVNRVSAVRTESKDINRFIPQLIPFSGKNAVLRFTATFLRVILSVVLLISLIQFIQNQNSASTISRVSYAGLTIVGFALLSLFAQVYCLLIELRLLESDRWTIILKRAIDIIWLFVFFAFAFMQPQRYMEFPKTVFAFGLLSSILIILDNLFIVFNIFPRIIGVTALIPTTIFAIGLIRADEKTEKIYYKHENVFGEYYKNADSESYVAITKIKIQNFTPDTIALFGISKRGSTPFFYAEDFYFEKNVPKKNFNNIYLGYFNRDKFIYYRQDDSRVKEIKFTTFDKFRFDTIAMPPTSYIEFYIAFHMIFAKGKRMLFDKLTINFDFEFSENRRKEFYTYFDFSKITPSPN